MDRFDRIEEAAESTMASDRLQRFTQALFDALVPPSGECVSVQGEIVRANGRLQSEYFRNAMGNYYWDESEEGHADVATTYFGALVLFLLDTLIANRNQALDAEDVEYFTKVRSAVQPDYVRRRRIEVLEEREDPTDAETAELSALEEAESADPFWWEAFFDRAERCVANWCLANPELIDRQGRPVTERGVRRVEQVLAS